MEGDKSQIIKYSGLEVGMYCGEKEIRVGRMETIRANGYRTGNIISGAQCKIKMLGP